MKKLLFFTVCFLIGGFVCVCNAGDEAGTGGTESQYKSEKNNNDDRSKQQGFIIKKEKMDPPAEGSAAIGSAEELKNMLSTNDGSKKITTLIPI